MRAEIEARIAALKVEYEAKIAAEEAKLKSFLENVPAELHDLEMATWDKIKAWLASL